MNPYARSLSLSFILQAAAIDVHGLRRKNIVLTEMRKNILLKRLPGKLQCEELKHKYQES